MIALTSFVCLDSDDSYAAHNVVEVSNATEFASACGSSESGYESVTIKLKQNVTLDNKINDKVVNIVTNGCDVTIDLQNYTLTVPIGASLGVYFYEGDHTFTIKNGTITGQGARISVGNGEGIINGLVVLDDVVFDNNEWSYVFSFEGSLLQGDSKTTIQIKNSNIKSFKNLLNDNSGEYLRVKLEIQETTLDMYNTSNSVYLTVYDSITNSINTTFADVVASGQRTSDQNGVEIPLTTKLINSTAKKLTISATYVCPHSSKTLHNAKTDAACNEFNHSAYYSCSCGALFASDGTTAITEIPDKVAGAHNYDTSTWADGEDGYHYHVCSVCNEKDDATKEAHAFGEDNKCTACGIEKGHTHSYPDSWTYDKNNHWKVCDCGHKGELATHNYGEDLICDVCGYETTAPSGESGGNDGGFPIIAIVGVVAVLAIAGVGAFFYLRNKP